MPKPAADDPKFAIFKTHPFFTGATQAAEELMNLIFDKKQQSHQQKPLFDKKILKGIVKDVKEGNIKPTQKVTAGDLRKLIELVVQL